MTNVVDETQSVIIDVVEEEGYAAISNVRAPSSVQPGESFSISYDVTNTGVSDTLFGQLLEGTTIVDEWSQIVDPSGTIPVSVSFPSGITTATTFQIKAGHVE